MIASINKLSAGEKACPCCGHDPNHKVKNGGICATCNGIGGVSYEDGIHFMEQMNMDFELQEKTTHN